MKIHLPDKKLIDVNRLKEIELPDIKAPKIKVKLPIPERFIPVRYDISAPGCASAALSFALLLAGFFIPLEGWSAIALYSLSILLSGWETVLSLLDCFSSGGIFCEELVCVIASAADFAVGNHVGAATIMLGFRLLRLLERLIDIRVGGIVDELEISVPKKVRIETEYGYKKIPAKRIGKNSLFVVDKKHTVPVDGIVVEGKSTLELYPLTGISETVEVGEGEKVFSGSINLTGRLLIKAVCSAAQSEAKVLGDYIFDACTSSSPREELIKKWAQIFFAFTAAAGLVVGFAVPLLTGGGWREWISRGALIASLSFSFILIQAVSAAFISGLAVCTSHGIIVKSGTVLEKIARTTTFIFNKTGTLTEKKFYVEEVFPEDLSDYELLLISAAAEQYSSHPIARAICNACPDYERFEKNQIVMEEIPCRGISATIKGRHIFVGNAGLLEEHGIRCKMARLGTTAAHVSVNGKYCGYIVLSNRVKENAFDALEALRAQKINNIVMLTGDLHTVSRRVASSLNMDMVKAELNGKTKRSVVKYLTESNDSENKVAFVCCGCEDKALFSIADVGISVGALGSREAEENADVIILKDDLEQVAECVSAASGTLRKCLINVIAFFSVKLFCLMFALTGILGEFPLFAADIAASVFIIFNSFSMLKSKEE